MTNYTIIEPHIEFFDPPDETNYLEFLERCTRVCYKSEHLCKEGSAEKLLNKVVKNYEHYSVTEHANCIMEVTYINGPSSTMAYIGGLLKHNPLMRWSIDEGEWSKGCLPGETTSTTFKISGNVRMWLDLFKSAEKDSYVNIASLKSAFCIKFPFFGNITRERAIGQAVKLLDENPLTNKDNLSPEEMKKHMTMTYKLVGSRTMSHQAVRHRLFAFSQESMRYVNYGKKGFQFIIPPSMDKFGVRELFTTHAVVAYGIYRVLLGFKVPPEDARFILPNASKTEVVTTGTLGYWIDHIIPHRGKANPKAQWEIRMLVDQVEEHMKSVLPKELFNA